MAVVWVKQRRAREWSDDDKPSAKAQRVYLVKCDDVNDAPDLAALACPTTAYASGLPVTARDAKYYDSTADGGVLYEVTIDYATVSTDPSKQDPNPLLRPAIVSLSFDNFEETVYTQPERSQPLAEDTDGNTVPITSDKWLWGNAVVNSAGQPFDPSIKDTFADPVLTVMKNSVGIPFDQAIEYCDTINVNDFTITYRGRAYTIKSDQAWLYNIATSPQFENDVYYEQVTFTFKLRKDGWRRKVLDQGLAQFPNGDVSPSHPAEPIRDKNGDPVTKPVLLDGKGVAVGGQGGGSKPVFLKFLLKREKDFSALGL
jgi:hypothetical protein